MAVLNMIFYTAVTLGILVFVHELGHFIAAKLTGMRVDRFSIGFPPRAFGKKIGDTDYCISWLPLGGYVKIAGMVDESFDTEYLNREPQPWEFRARPMWARILVISAGVIMNILLALVIFTNIHFVRGKDSMKTTEVGYVQESSPAFAAGLRAGDEFLTVNGEHVDSWEQVQQEIYIENLGNDFSFTVERGGSTLDFVLKRPPTSDFSMENLGFFIGHSASFVNAVEHGMPAESLGLRSGDTIVAVNGTTIGSRQQIVDEMRRNPGKPVELTWNRAGSLMTGTVVVSGEGRIGISIGSIYQGPMEHTDYSIFEAVGQGVAEVRQTVHLFVLTVKKIVVGEASVKQSFGGPIAIAQLATQSAEYGFMAFIWFMAQLSMSLAILNILPIPALDGGHLILLIIEKVSRREIPHKVKIAIQQVGFILLLAFMAFIIYNDIAKF